mmetsp:Transcript_77580/g.169840  ORF Transcript_77580/g.169840 Transcript_77580/m.169840 type:complete len:341 (+) Transcript_77580:1172-2194(+)
MCLRRRGLHRHGSPGSRLQASSKDTLCCRPVSEDRPKQLRRDTDRPQRERQQEQQQRKEQEQQHHQQHQDVFNSSWEWSSGTLALPSKPQDQPVEQIQMQQQQQQQQQELKMQRQRNHHQELEHEQNEHQHQLPLPPVVSALVFASCPMSEGVSTPMKPTLPRLTGSALQVPIPMPIAEVFGTSVAGSPSTLRSASPGESDGGLSPVFLGPYVDGGGQKRLQALRARGQFLVDCGTSAIAQMATEVNDYDIVAPSSPSVSPSPPIDGDFLGQAAVNLGSSRLQRLRALGRGLDADSSSSSPLADVARGQKPRCDRFKALRCDVSRKSHIRSSSKTKSGIL